MIKCPHCGSDECSSLYVQDGTVVGCDICVTPIEYWQIPLEEEPEEYDTTD